jgi:2-methylcitrate dehydratase PrpD
MPTTGLQGKFSAEYVVAAALGDGELTIDSFSDQMVRRPEMVALMRKVDLVERPSEGPAAEFGSVEIEMGGHTVRHTTTDFPFLNPENARALLVDKFGICAAHCAAPLDVDTALKGLWSIDGPDVVNVSSLLSNAAESTSS